MSPQCWHLTSKCDLDLWGTDLGLAHATPTDEDECICEIILNSIEKSQSNGPDKLNLSQFWPLTSKCDLDLWGTDLIRAHAAPTDDEECICEIIFKFHWEISELWSGQAQFEQILTFDLQVWPWPLRYRPDSCACRTDWWWGMHMWNNF